jgi:beta-barrel assembly-enhancing protease
MQRREFLRLGGRALLGTGLLTGLSGCETMDALSNTGASLNLGQVFGPKVGAQAESALRITGAAASASEQLNPEQEYYLGRTVAAHVLTRYEPFEDRAANDYLNAVGNYVRLASNQPETFGGYHFQIVDSDEINAFSAPGGLVIITRGMLRCCSSEDALAAVLAHEVGHVEYRHGVQAIQRSRMTTLMTTIGSETMRYRGSDQLIQLVAILDGAIEDILRTMVDNGYSRGSEGEADRAAVVILKRAGYDELALVEMLQEMQRRLRPGGTDFAKTHPTPTDRIAQIEPHLRTAPKPRNPVRQARFERALRNV